MTHDFSKEADGGLHIGFGLLHERVPLFLDDSPLNQILVGKKGVPIIDGGI
jgi:hypothetical protein